MISFEKGKANKSGINSSLGKYLGASTPFIVPPFFSFWVVVVPAAGSTYPFQQTYLPFLPNSFLNTLPPYSTNLFPLGGGFILCIRCLSRQSSLVKRIHDSSISEGKWIKGVDCLSLVGCSISFCKAYWSARCYWIRAIFWSGGGDISLQLEGSRKSGVVWSLLVVPSLWATAITRVVSFAFWICNT